MKSQIIFWHINLVSDQESTDLQKGEQEAQLQSRLKAIRTRIDQAYLEKLDGKISKEYWSRKSADRSQQEQQVLLALQGLKQACKPERVLDAKRILELANKANSLY